MKEGSNGIVAAVIQAAAVLGSAMFIGHAVTKPTAKEQVNAAYVAAALNVLATPSSSINTITRAWAAEALIALSPAEVPLPPNARQELLGGAIPPRVPEPAFSPSRGELNQYRESLRRCLRPGEQVLVRADLAPQSGGNVYTVGVIDAQGNKLADLHREDEIKTCVKAELARLPDTMMPGEWVVVSLVTRPTPLPSASN